LMWTKWRLIILVVLDIFLINLAFLIAFFLRFFDQGGIPVEYYQASANIFLPATVIYLTSFYIFKLYKRAWSYASTGELLAVINAVTVGALATITATYFLQSQLPRSIIVLAWAFTLLLVGGSRFIWRLYVERKKGNGVKPGRRALIVGAGDAGVMVARELCNNRHIDLRPVAFVDDEPAKKNLSLMGIPVLGGRDDIPKIVDRYGIDEIIIAIPSADGRAIRGIVEICRPTRASIKVLPGVYEIIDGRVSIDRLRPLQLEDLLHREPVNIDLKSIAGYLRGRVVLVTGAGGSIGSELCRQIAEFGPSRLVVLGHGENSIHKIWRELSGSFPELDLAVEIADVRDLPRIEYIFGRHRPAVVFHAAAHKHVPLMEMHPAEAVKTNVSGTRNVARAAHRSGTKTFILVSTDKAVNPSSVMGASKLLAELIIRQMNNYSGTVFAAVRFGNVLGSNGSVVQVFKDQIKQGGPVTVTHRKMTRYFMTIPEAVSLIIQAGALAGGGELFLLDMGDPVKIVDLACDMIRLSGYEPGRDIDIVFTGIRPGEKLFEELLTSEEGASATRHKKIFTARPCLVDATALEKELLGLEKLSFEIDGEKIFRVLKRVVPGFSGFRRHGEETETKDGVAGGGFSSSISN